MQQKQQILQTQRSILTTNVDILAAQPNKVLQVAVEWKANGNNPAVGARSVNLYVKKHAVPDLAEAPAMGMAGNIEPTQLHSAPSSRTIAKIDCRGLASVSAIN